MDLEITDSQFEEEVEKSDQKVLLMFWGSWCPVCKKVEVLLNEIVEEHDDKLKIRKMNVDRNPHTAVKCNIMGTPTFLLFDKGEIKKSAVGSLSKEQLLAFFEDGN